MSRVVFLLTVAFAASIYFAIGAREDDAVKAFDRPAAEIPAAGQKKLVVIRCYAASGPDGKLAAVPCNPPLMDGPAGLKKLPCEPLAF